MQTRTQQSPFKRINFAKRQFKVYDVEQKHLSDRMCIKMEKFFLDYYPLIQKQIFLDVERTEVE